MKIVSPRALTTLGRAFRKIPKIYKSFETPTHPSLFFLTIHHPPTHYNSALVLKVLSALLLAFCWDASNTQGPDVRELYTTDTMEPFRRSFDQLNTADSLHSSRFSLGSRERVTDTLDVSIQVDLAADVITYDSDDEGDTPTRMSGRRRGAGGEAGGAGVARNKRGTPMYSREDIREQYCINDKELHALEASRRKPIFGCLTSGNTQPSPCKKKSLLPACLRGRVPSDENVYSKTQSAHTSPAHRKTQPEEIDYEDETYFRRRPKTICYTDPRRLASLDDSLARSGRVPRPRSEVPPNSAAQYDSYLSDDAHPDDAASRRPTQLAITSSEYHSTEIFPEDSTREGYTLRRTAYTQPNTPDLGHSTTRFRQVTTPEVFLDDRPQKHVSFQKAMSRSATVGGLEEHGGLSQEDNGGRGGGSRSHERLLDGRRSPDYVEQRALDHLLAPVLTKALLQEKLKRSCMRTQATQTDAGVVRKSMPHLSLSPASEKAEMISQGAQTNGDGGRRKLVKSLSEVARYEGVQYEIYDLDDLTEPPLPTRAMSEGPPPCPPRFSTFDIPLDEGPPPPPLKFRQNYHEIFIDSSPHKPRRGLLQKTLSEGEILSERRKALSLASGYLEVDINGYSDNEEEVIEPQCVNEVSRDLSRSRIFTPDSFIEEEEEFHENMLHKEILPSILPCERKLSQVSTDSDLKTFDPNEFRTEEHLQSQLAALSLDSLAESGPALLETGSFIEGLCAREGSPMLYVGTPSEATGVGEFGDHLEESMSESQVTVVQRAFAASSQVITSDSENGSFHLTDHSSAATTPSTRHKSLPTAGSFEEDLDDELLPRLRVSSLVHSATTLSSIEDEQTSVSENVISDSSQGVTVSTTSSEVDRAIACSTDNDYSSIRSGESMTIKSEVLEEEEFEGDIIIEENIMAKMVQEMKDGESVSQTSIKTSDFRDDARRMASPESDSSSSLFTEQETSRSPVSGTTNTMTSKSDLSRTDSHPTDQSETSEDYITATENSTNDQDARRSYSLEERHVSSPPGMADIYEDEALTPKITSPEMSEVLASLHEHHELSDITEGFSVASDFETAQDLTSPDGDTTTSASYYIDHSLGEESDKIIETKAKPEIPPKPTFLPKPEVPPKPERLSPSRETSPKPLESREIEEYEIETTVRKREKCPEESKTGAIKKRYSAGGKVAKDDNRRYSRYFEDNDKGELSEVRGQSQQSWSEEEREKTKQALKLDFPPGVTMFGEAPSWPEQDNLKTGEVEKKLKVFDKPKKSVKIDLASVEDLQALRSKEASPNGKEGEVLPSSEVKPTKAKHDKVKRKSEEITTPGMVRSPAMHEGFRLEDWTPVRTPVTPPERSMDVDTSDESYSEAPRHPPKGRSPGRRSKDSPGRKGDSPSLPGESPVRQVSERQSPGRIISMTRESPQRAEVLRESPRQSPRRSGVQQVSPIRDTIAAKMDKSVTHPVEVHQRHSPIRYHKPGVDQVKRLSEIPVGSAREAPEAVKRHSADITITGRESHDLLKPAGPVTGYLRTGTQSPTSRERPLQLPESKLLAIAPMKDSRRSAESLRSMSPGSDNVFLSGSREQLDEDTRPALCVQCGERPASREGLLRPSPPAGVTVERRFSDREPSRPRTVGYRAKSEERNSFTKDWGMTPISLEQGDAPRHDSDDDEKGIYLDPYRNTPWLYVDPSDEAKVWRRDEGSPSPMPQHLRIPGFDDELEPPCDTPEPDSRPDSRQDTLKDALEDSLQDTLKDLVQDTILEHQETREDLEEEEKQGHKEKSRRGSLESTCSEKDFRRRYQAITHRMVHRKASVEMYRRLVQATFQSDKTVTVSRESGEFGFRIHGSRPVVVSAIEPDTPAETSGLEVGDIIININGANVLDASHSEVVRLAHAGCDTLRLEVARTCDVLTPLVTHDPTPLCAGYLYKLGGAHHTSGSSTIIRKWHRRWFALKKDHCLYYYKSEMEQHPLGAVHLLDYSVHALADVGKPFSFTVAKFGGMTLHLAAHTEEARNRWGQVITQAAAEAAQRDELMEISSRRVQQAPASIASPDCFGFLHKLGARWHQWKRRYCVLKDACLYLYHDTDATQAIGVVHLHGYRVQSTSIGGKKHAFELLPPEPKFRHFYFYTESDSDKKRWLAALEYSIDRWIKVG